MINQRVTSNTKVLKSNWFSNIKGRFDIIYANPPYVRSEDISNLGAELNYDPKIALNGGIDGLFCYKQISKNIFTKKKMMFHIILLGLIVKNVNLLGLVLHVNLRINVDTSIHYTPRKASIAKIFPMVRYY